MFPLGGTDAAVINLRSFCLKKLQNEKLAWLPIFRSTA